MKFANDYGLDTSCFVPLVPLFQKIVKDHPAHQLGGRHANAASKFVLHHGAELHAAGIIIRLQSGTWLADPARLPAAVLLLKTGGKLEPLPSSATADKPQATRRGSAKRAKRGKRTRARAARPLAELST